MVTNLLSALFPFYVPVGESGSGPGDATTAARRQEVIEIYVRRRAIRSGDRKLGLAGGWVRKHLGQFGDNRIGDGQQRRLIGHMIWP